MIVAYLLEKIGMEKELLLDLIRDQAHDPQQERTIVILSVQCRIQAFEELMEELSTGTPTVRKVREIPRPSKKLKLVRSGSFGS
jgi:hypothetical protein